MIFFIPHRYVAPPSLTSEEVSRIYDGDYVEGNFGLEEGSVFTLSSEGNSSKVMCYYRNQNVCRIRRMVANETEGTV